MRKKFFIASVAISAITLFLACAGGKTETTEEAEGKNFNTLISEGDFAGAHAMLLETISDCNNDMIFGIDEDDVYSMADALYKDWILDIIYSDTNNPEMAISQLLAEYPILGKKIGEGLQSSECKYEPFVFGTSHYNQLCDKIFTAALMVKKYDIAESIVNAYMKDIEIVEGDGHNDNNTALKVNGVKVDYYHCYVTYSTKSQTEARKKLDEARKNSEQQ